jgi:hypothetical protein
MDVLYEKRNEIECSGVLELDARDIENTNVVEFRLGTDLIHNTSCQV